MIFGRLPVLPCDAAMHAEMFVANFVARSKQDQYLKLLRDPKRYGDFFFDALHAIELDWSFATMVSDAKLRQRDRDMELLERSADALGVERVCCVFDDGMRKPTDAFQSTIRDAFHQHLPKLGWGKLFSVAPGRLAWYEGDMMGSYLCERSNAVQPGAHHE
jgi:hypothetical protein